MILFLIPFVLCASYLLKKHEQGKEYLIFLVLVLFFGISWHSTFKIFIEITIFLFLFCQFFLLSFIQSKKTQYYVILGCGLLDGNRISPLLMDRCNIAIQLYQNQRKKIVVSGGKGKNETSSEAYAMKMYLLSKGIQSEDIICEEKSKTTLENLIYTTKIIGSTFTVITSDYHALRVYLLSKHYRYSIDIFVSHTQVYYRVYALVREYFALLILLKNKIILAFLLYLILFIYR